MNGKKMLLLLFSCSLRVESTLADDCGRAENAIAVVVASLGRSNADGEAEDLSWLTKRAKSSKDVRVYQRTRPKKKHYIDTLNGNECLTYATYIKDNYECLPDAVVFVHADARRHCPTITSLLELSNEDILMLLWDPARQVDGYLALSKVFLNQSKANLERFKYPLLELSNYVQTEKYEFQKHRAQHPTLAGASLVGGEDDYQSAPLPALAPAAPRLPDDQLRRNAASYASNYEFCDAIDRKFPFSAEYPAYITTYTSGSFAVTRENIRSYPRHFYKQLAEHLSSSRGGRGCGYLEYIWTTMWGGEPFRTALDADRSCGPLYYTDISRSGFEFFASDDGSVEAGQLPEGYRGHINLRPH